MPASLCMLLATLVALAAGCGGHAREADRPPPPSRAPSGERVDPFEALRSPAPLDRDARAELRRRAAGRADLEAIPEEPSVGGVGAQLVDADSELPRVPYDVMDHRIFNAEPEPGARGPMARVHQRLLAREPRAELSGDGTVTVTFETLHPIPAASVYYGTRLPQALIRRPRYRKRASALERLGGGDTRYAVTFSVRSLFKPKYDVTDLRATGRAEVAWRLEALDPKEGTSRLFDGRIAYRCEETPCTRETPLVRLPTVELGPFVDAVSPEGAVVWWETDAATAGQVVVVAEDGEQRWFASETPGTRHEVRLRGLSPASRYRYYVAAVDARGEVSLAPGATFQTAPARDADQAFTFVVLSDSRSGQGAGEQRYAGTNRRVLVDLLVESLRFGPGFAVFVGDLVDGYTTETAAFRFELEAWLQSVEPIGAYLPIYEVMGNHEALMDFWEVGWAIDKSGEESAEAVFASLMVNPENAPDPAEGAPPFRENVYSWDWGNAHFASVNSNYFYRSHPEREDHPAADRGQREGWVDDRTLAWLDEDLARARQRGARHLFVFTHEPAFPNGGHVEDGMYWNGEVQEVLERRDAFARVVGRHGATLFHGDEHNYSRTRIDAELVEGLERPFWQFISGGAGAPYYAQEDTPWSDRVAVFDLRQHLIVVTVDGEEAHAETIAVTGETIDRVSLPPAPSGPPAR